MKADHFRCLSRRTALLLLCLTASGSGFTQRRVTQMERGSIYMTPRRNDWSKIGIYVGSPKSLTIFRAMRPEALKVAHGRIQHFGPKDEKEWALFPYEELKQYESDEIAAGRDPIFITATYQGKKRPVYFKWSVNPNKANIPAAPQKEWQQAVNIRDERFVRFWAEKYVRKVWPTDLQNMWMGADTCAFMYSLYGVMDDDGKFVTGVRWDKPFAQNNDEFLQSVETFFTTLKRIAPDIKVMCNLGSLEDWRKFPEVYRNAPGIMAEDIVFFLNQEAKSYVRAQAYQRMMWFRWSAEQDKVVLLRAIVPKNEEALIRTATVAYLLVQGDNFFFAPQGPSVTDNVDMDRADAIRQSLGMPTGDMQAALEPKTSGEGYRLYSRRCRNGMVYLNLTGKTKTIPLPEDRAYYDRSGKRVSEIVLDDLQGDYVVTRPAQE